MQFCSSSIIYVSTAAYLSASSSALHNASSIYIYDSHNHSYLCRIFLSLMCKRLLDIIEHIEDY